MALHPSTDAALAGAVVTIAGLIEIEFPGYTLRLCDGSAEIDNGGTRFTGFDDRFGLIDAMSVVESGEGNAAPAIDLTFLPPSGTAAADISAPVMQGSRVRCWLAAIDQATGSVIGSAERFYFGLVDTTELVVGRGTRALNVQCVSGFERMFAVEEGQRLADAFHQSIWPGELGLANVTGITKNVPWGVEAPNRGYTYSTAGGGLSSTCLEDRVRVA